MNNENAVLKEAIGKINEKLNAVMNKVKQGEIRDSAIMINDALKGIDEIYVIIENIYGMNNTVTHDINNSIEKVIIAYEKNNSVLIKLNLEKLKELILSIDVE